MLKKFFISIKIKSVFQKGDNMKKVLLALAAVLTLAACTGSYKSGNCQYDFLLHKDISISKIIGNATGGC